MVKRILSYGLKGICEPSLGAGIIIDAFSNSIDYLKPIFKLFDAFEEKPKFFEGLEGIDQILTGLANSGFLTAEAFAALAREAEGYFNKMTKAKDEGGLGFTDEQAIRMM